VSFRDDGDALLARNEALEAENARLREENDQLKEPTKALVRKTPQQITVPRERWYIRGFTVIVWVISIVIGILTGVL